MTQTITFIYFILITLPHENVSLCILLTCSMRLTGVARGVLLKMTGIMMAYGIITPAWLHVTLSSITSPNVVLNPLPHVSSSYIIQPMVSPGFLRLEEASRWCSAAETNSSRIWDSIIIPVDGSGSHLLAINCALHRLDPWFRAHLSDSSHAH